MNALVEANKSAAKTAATQATGQKIIEVVRTALVKKVPALEGLINTPVGSVLLANIAAYGLQTAMPNNDKAAAIADALMAGSMAAAMEELGLTDALQTILDGVESVS